MEILRKIRKAKGLTQKQLGEMCGVSESTINRIEIGNRKPSYELIVKLSKALDCSADKLLGRSGLVVTDDGIPFVEVETTVDDSGNIASALLNLNTMLTGDEEHDGAIANLLNVLSGASVEEIRQAMKVIEALKK